MKIVLSTILLFVCLNLMGQEGQFSQYYASSAILNPAFIGINPNVSFNTNYKRSGNRSSEAFLELMQATVSYPFKRSTSRDFQTGAAGITFWRESRGFEGIYTAQKVLLTGAYAIKLSRLSNQTIVFGLQGGFVQNQISGNNLQWGSQFSRYIGFDDVRQGEVVSSEAFFYPAFNFGVIYSNFDNTNYYIRDRSIQIGASVDYLNEPGLEQEELGIAKRNMILRAFGSASFQLAPKVSIYPSGYFLYSDGNQQINAGVYLSTLVSAPRAFNAVVIQAGSWYRLNDAFILLAGIKINEIRIGISVDLNASSFDINEALGSTLPSYELSLTYNFSLSQSFQNVSSPIF
ncbi:MAG: PorP/SprF family type IX secretion system membrane protein [Ekhidna sp.]|nr:PorP/SprF family type IX secretion system membrane protein [Ekhidna sp.]